MHNSYRNIFMAINQASKYSNGSIADYMPMVFLPYCKQFNQNLISTWVQICLYLCFEKQPFNHIVTLWLNSH